MTSTSFWAFDSRPPLRWLKFLNRLGECEQALRQKIDSINIVAVRIASGLLELQFRCFDLIHKIVGGTQPPNDKKLRHPVTKDEVRQ